MLRRRALIEHVIAGISTRLINAEVHETAAHVERALGELAKCVAADRAYFIMSGKAMQVYRWCRRGSQFPTLWPEQAIDLSLPMVHAANKRKTFMGRCIWERARM